MAVKKIDTETLHIVGKFLQYFYSIILIVFRKHSEERRKANKLKEQEALNESDKPQLPSRIIKKHKMSNMVDKPIKQQREESVKRVDQSLSLQSKVAIPKDQLLPKVMVCSFCR
jgi:hypothetical protein